MQTNQPDLSLLHNVNDLPASSLLIKLLDACPISVSLIANCVKEPLGERAAVGSSDSLSQLRQSVLLFVLQMEGFALLKIIAFQRTADDVDLIILLSDSKIYPVVEHVSQHLELLRCKVE